MLQLRDWCAAEGGSALLRLHPLGGPGTAVGNGRRRGPGAWPDERRRPLARRGGTPGRDEQGPEGRPQRGATSSRSWEAGEERWSASAASTTRRCGGSAPASTTCSRRSTTGSSPPGSATARRRAGTPRDDEVVGGSLFMADRRYAHYHLSGATDAGRELKAGTLLVHEGAVWATARVRASTSAAARPAPTASTTSSGASAARSTPMRSPPWSRIAGATTTLVARRAEEPEPPRPGFFPHIARRRRASCG